MSDFWLDIVNLKNAMHLKKISEELMPIAWHHRILWKFCMPEDEEKEIEPNFYWAFNVYNMEVLKHFTTWYNS